MKKREGSFQVILWLSEFDNKTISDGVTILCHHETTWLKNCPKAFKPVHYKRYVDDIFVLFEKPEQVSRFVNYMNKRHKNI